MMTGTIHEFGACLLACAVLAGPAFGAPPSVVADTPVTHSLVAMVMEGVGEPVLLLDKGGDPHDFQLRPSQAGALADADMVVWIGPEMTPWLEGSLPSAGSTQATLRLLEVEGTRLRHADGDGHSHDASQDDAGAKHDGGADPAQGGILDPHAWLDPRNAELWLGAIAAELARIDPDDAKTYSANAESARRRIQALDADLERRLAPAKSAPIGVYHDAYGYLAERYGLTIAGSIAQGDAHDPGAAHLARLQDHLKGATCLFPEVGHDDRAAETLAADAGVRVGPALNPEGIGMDPGPDLYPALMAALADGILACIEGG